MEEFDANKNYYDILGVKTDATAEELKLAHIKLALVHHPDVIDKETANPEDKQNFLDILEAWTVLSKPELRAKYDASRNINTGAFRKPVVFSTADISPSFMTQRNNYEQVKRSASSNWKEVADKYRQESWQLKPLVEKKAHRARHVMPLSNALMKHFMPGIAFVVAATVIVVANAN